MTEANFKRMNGSAPRHIPRPARWRIEGENVTFAEIAKRIGVTPACAQQRMLSLRNASGPITWSRLKAIGA